MSSPSSATKTAWIQAQRNRATPMFPDRLLRSFRHIVTRFHFDPRDLRCAMAVADSVLSGSAALALIHQNRFLPSDLDFYVLPPGFPSFLKFVLNNGYHVVTDEDPGSGTERYSSGAFLVLTLAHQTSARKINIIVSSDRHVVGTLTQFHSTLVMNYVAWYGLVCLYPVWTVNNKGLIVDKNGEEKGCFQKYRARGFFLHDDVRSLTDVNLNHTCGLDYPCVRMRRNLHDTFGTLATFDNLPIDISLYEPPVTWTLPVKCVEQ